MSSRNAGESGTDMAGLRRKLAGRSGQHYWRSLEELADSAEFQEILEQAFPRLAPLRHLLLYTSPTPRDRTRPRMSASA